MDDLLAKLYQPLEIAIFSKEAYSSFKLRSQAPAWLIDLVGEKKLKTACYLDEIFPFIECFLPDFEQHWDNQRLNPLLSDIWIENSSNNEEIPLEASAIWLDGASFILIQNSGKKYREHVALLQKARNNALTREIVESGVDRCKLKMKRQREAMV